VDDCSLHTAFSTEHAETPTLNYLAATQLAAAAAPERRVEAGQQPNLDAQQLLRPRHEPSETAACVVVIGVDGEGVPHVLVGPHALLPGRVESAGSVRDAWCDATGGMVRRLLGLEQRPLVMLAGEFDGGLFGDSFGNVVRVAACPLFTSS